MLEEVNLEETGGHCGVLEPGKDRDGAVEDADGLGTRGASDFHPLFRLSQEPICGAGTDFFEFLGHRIGHVSQPDGVKVLHEEGGEQLSPGPVEIFLQ
jgi:hypothetical protein